MPVSENDRTILRKLAEEQAKIAALPIQKQTIAEWTRLNSNQPGRPLVWINEIPWHEMDVNGELELHATDSFCRHVEQAFRRRLYQWKHLPADMVVEPKAYSPLVINDTGFGIAEDVHVATTDAKSGIVSRDFRPQIDCEKDIEKIKTPVVTLDREATERTFAALTEIFGDILSVEKVGIVHTWFAPWDELIRWWDVQKAMMDLVLRPQLVHAAMDRLVSAHLARLAQWRALNLLSSTAGNYRVGSGGLGYAPDLPQKGFDSARARTADMWGCSTAQIFSDVSPKMHEEFALKYERRWLEQFGLNYYGCCEPLHNKVELLKTIPNLRKVSVSPWADVAKMVERTNVRYVLSYKPSPAILAEDTFDIERARKDLSQALERMKGCAVEVIMKDISTLRYEPRRLWDWAGMAMEAVRSA
jgi:hypothetical protein